MQKTISCGDVRAEHASKTVTLAGWVHRRRDHGGLIFIDLRDREGIVQVVFNPELVPDAHEIATQLRNEWVIQVAGQVVRRPEGTENAALPTGEIEVSAEHVGQVVREEHSTRLHPLESYQGLLAYLK